MGASEQLYVAVDDGSTCLITTSAAEETETGTRKTKT